MQNRLTHTLIGISAGVVIATILWFIYILVYFPLSGDFSSATLENIYNFAIFGPPILGFIFGYISGAKADRKEKNIQSIQGLPENIVK